MAGSGWRAPGVNNTPEYQVSGVPWVTGSLAIAGTVNVSFPNVSKFFVVKANSADVTVGFHPDGFATSHFFTVVSGSSQTFDLRVVDIYLQGGGTVDILAGLTAIPRRNYQPLTGANPPPDGTWYVPGIE